jgi:hypothetical protein
VKICSSLKSSFTSFNLNQFTKPIRSLVSSVYEKAASRFPSLSSDTKWYKNRYLLIGIGLASLFLIVRRFLKTDESPQKEDPTNKFETKQEISAGRNDALNPSINLETVNTFYGSLALHSDKMRTDDQGFTIRPEEFTGSCVQAGAGAPGIDQTTGTTGETPQCIVFRMLIKANTDTSPAEKCLFILQRPNPGALWGVRYSGPQKILKQDPLEHSSLFEPQATALQDFFKNLIADFKNTLNNKEPQTLLYDNLSFVLDTSEK